MEEIKEFEEKVDIIKNCLKDYYYIIQNNRENNFKIKVYYKKDSTIFIKKYSITLVYSINNTKTELKIKSYIDDDQVEFNDLLFNIIDIKPFIIKHTPDVEPTISSTTTSFSNINLSSNTSSFWEYTIED